MQGELVTFKTNEGFHLNGILFGAERSSTTVVHVHGSFGNYFQNRFISIMAESYRRAGLNFLSFNLASHDGVAEGYWHIDEFHYVGGALVPFESCLSDIAGAVAFCRSFSDRIVLQGHSLGCDRILSYLLKRDENHDFILLSPCDSYELQRLWIDPESVEDQITRIKAGGQSDDVFDWLPIREYGIRNADENYPIPITRRAFLSIAEGPPFRLLRLANPERFWVSANAAVYLGGRDSFQTSSCENMFAHLEARVHKVTRIYVSDGDHSMTGVEAEVAGRLADWVNR